MNNLDNVEVKDAPGKGRGLFAKKDFKKGELVLDWNQENKFLTKEEVEQLAENLKKYVAVYKGKHLLIPEPERYMNHSSDPNTETLEDGTDIALRDIREGEEITGDYAKEGTLVGFRFYCEKDNCWKEMPSTII